ncbi:MAG: YdcF family protein [Clostridia bacterium]|nr:YdcF family protein [Clostridia bacterium]
MKKLALQIAVLAGLMLLVCVVSRLAMGNTYTVNIPVYGNSAEDRSFELTAQNPDVLSFDSPRVRSRYISMPVHPREQGETFLEVRDAGGETIAIESLRVGRFLTVYNESTGGFTGDTVVMVAFTVFCLAVSALMLRAFLNARGAAFYAYSTIYTAGFSIFALLTGLLMLFVTARRLIDPANYSMLYAYSAICSASVSFMWITLPLIVAFSVAMAVSNAALLRHENAKLKNVLGLLVSGALLGGAALGLYMSGRDFVGSERAMRAFETANNVYATVFVYFECMLIGAIICGLKAARHVPSRDRDFIVILGCYFRKDGSLPPLLKGRVDKAIEFWSLQKRENGTEAVFVPSGGQGPDESMPEAEAMRRYLVEKGVPERCIMVEDRSRNTYQNMQFSKELIDAARPGARTAYATTNYHVFRSGVWAGLAGLPAEGVGSRTRWWYWPNAFMRECAGLLVNRWKQEIVLLIVLVAFFGALSMVLG